MNNMDSQVKLSKIINLIFFVLFFLIITNKLNMSLKNLINSKIFSEIVCENPNCNSVNLPGCNATQVGLGIDRNKSENYSNLDYYYYQNKCYGEKCPNKIKKMIMLKTIKNKQE
jgi:hypothetical protein